MAGRDSAQKHMDKKSNYSLGSLALLSAGIVGAFAGLGAKIALRSYRPLLFFLPELSSCSSFFFRLFPGNSRCLKHIGSRSFFLVFSGREMSHFYCRHSIYYGIIIRRALCRCSASDTG